MGNDSKAQLDKFKQAARERECDEDEAAFDRALKQMKPAVEPKAKPAPKERR